MKYRYSIFWLLGYKEIRKKNEEFSSHNLYQWQNHDHQNTSENRGGFNFHKQGTINEVMGGGEDSNYMFPNHQKYQFYTPEIYSQLLFIIKSSG